MIAVYVEDCEADGSAALAHPFDAGSPRTFGDAKFCAAGIRDKADNLPGDVIWIAKVFTPTVWRKLDQVFGGYRRGLISDDGVIFGVVTALVARILYSQA